MTDCGASKDDCCTSLEVTGGKYYRLPNPISGQGSDQAPATVSSFRLDKYDVTVGRFRQFVAAWNGGAGWTPPAGSGKHTYLNGGLGLVDVGAGGGYETGWVGSDKVSIAPTSTNLACDSPSGTWTDSPGTQENLPINCVTWYEAYAFCIWDGGFLPSEAEWAYAAAGGSEQREYPWGSTDPGMGSQYAIHDCEYPVAGVQACGGPGTVTSIAPVGTAVLGAGRWGQLDLAGNLRQWTLDWYATYVDPCSDCAFLTASSQWPYRVYRGSRFNESAQSQAREIPIGGRNGGSGFRCARSP
jgi:formylglycine-generating enzyme required for sulfatase activity